MGNILQNIVRPTEHCYGSESCYVGGFALILRFIMFKERFSGAGTPNCGGVGRFWPEDGYIKVTSWQAFEGIKIVPLKESLTRCLTPPLQFTDIGESDTT